jgi:hypothetical protein
MDLSSDPYQSLFENPILVCVAPDFRRALQDQTNFECSGKHYSIRRSIRYILRVSNASRRSTFQFANHDTAQNQHCPRKRPGPEPLMQHDE